MSRFLRIKKKLGWERDPIKKHDSSYSCRHTFAHRMLAGYWNEGAGCSVEVLAELMGDTPQVAFDYYGKEWGSITRLRSGRRLESRRAEQNNLIMMRLLQWNR
ncbi:hypothetical protein OAG29_00115 [Planctomycetaceae bacterium]|nr:hypothetical protein [Planctomycetaceae bacterium]